jgi:hypothetical protein
MDIYTGIREGEKMLGIHRWVRTFACPSHFFFPVKQNLRAEIVRRFTTWWITDTEKYYDFFHVYFLLK